MLYALKGKYSPSPQQQITTCNLSNNINTGVGMVPAPQLKEPHVMNKEMIERLLREAFDVLSYTTPSTQSYRDICRRFVAQHG
jgi:hypothetical protein